MKTLKTVILTLIVIAVLVSLAILGVIYSGAYNVAATSKHWPVTAWLLDQTVHNSIAAHAEGIEVPALGMRPQILTGAANYEAMCAGCHAAPGVEQGLPGVAMYPQPPRLDQAAEEMTAAQLFWVIKHGIKASGMPAWGPSHGNEEIWSMVALIEQFPQMSAAEYTQLQQDANSSGMGHHGHGGDEPEHGDHTHAVSKSDAHEEANASPKTEADHDADGHSH